MAFDATINFSYGSKPHFPTAIQLQSTAMRYTLLFLLLASVGCGGIVTWGTVYSSQSRDGRGELRVDERGCFADCAVRVVIKRGWGTQQIAAKSDCVINFAHAEWAGSV